MRYIADLHIHSPYSRATSPAGNLAGLAAWAQAKGIHVLGTGDCTHPAWFSQICDQLVPAEPGFFRLKAERVAPALPGVTPAAIPVRFVLSTEISSIYKRHGQVRKVHNVLYLPDLASAARLNAKLAAIGNIESDGRPILGLDSRDLLEILLEVAPEGFLVPAHIWTPWFSLFGSKSGFDAVEECFGDLSQHVFALETGLSSDPAMNRRVSALDRFTLISNSDCHSPNKLGREANIFTTGFDYFSLREALKNPNGGGLAATVEFFPEEGKYHADGHRACQVCLEPHETRDLNALCPACGKPLTVGVLHRLLELADRDHPLFPPGAPAVHSIIPLPEILGELLDAGPATKGAMALYAKTIARFGSEFNLLLTTPLDEIKEVSPLLAEAVARVRAGNVIRKPGYDGEFGVIRVFAEGERQRLAGQGDLFAAKPSRKKKAPRAADAPLLTKTPTAAAVPAAPPARDANPEQETAITAPDRRLLITAGPGTGKTFTLVARLAHLLQQGVPAAHCVVITFTNRAAAEVHTRLDRAIGPAATAVFVGTFHRFCLDWLRQEAPELALVGDEERQRLLQRLFPDLDRQGHTELSRTIREYSEQLASDAAASPPAAVQRYLAELAQRQALDLDQVIPTFVARLRSDSRFRQRVTEQVRVLLVDEFQDLNASQYALVETLAETAQIFAIGDPNQAIYGFRGSDLRFFFQFASHPECRTLALTRNYRSAPEILAATTAVIDHNQTRGESTLLPQTMGTGRLEWQEAVTPAAEAEQIARRIEELVGGTSHHSLRTNRAGEATARAFGDIAILCRLSQQTETIHDALAQHGIPCQVVGSTPFYMKKPLRAVTTLLRVGGGNADAAEHLALFAVQPGIGTAAVERLDQAIPPACPDFFRAALALDLAPTTRSALIAMQHQQEQLRAVAQSEGLAAAISRACDLLAINGDDPAAQRFREFASLFGHDLTAFADHLRQHAQATAYDPRAEAVALMTMHAAKGLEFPVVFLPGLEEGLIPCTVGKRACDLEEERRLFYVALTRARELVCLSLATQRTLYGHSLHQQPSRFVAEIPATLLSRVTPRPQPRPKPTATQMKLFLKPCPMAHHSDDLPTPSTIRIGKAQVGLVGLDQAMAKVLATPDLNEDEAVAMLFAAIRRDNYVPAEAAPLYQEALRREYRRRLGQESGSGGTMTIRVLGPGCVSCNKLTTMLIEALQKLQLAADMESVHDLDAIWRFGVTKTPALIINNHVKCAGRMPSPAEVEQWVREEAG